MGKTIFITEKPSVAQSYREVLKVSGSKQNGYIEGFSPVLNKEVQITWAVGHLISLGCVEEQLNGKIMSASDIKSSKVPWKKMSLPVFPTNNWIYKVNYQTKDQYNVVKSLYTAPDVDAIYYAGDSGREGIYIQALIRNQIFKGKTPKCDEKVVWIDSFTDKAILDGIKNAKPYSDYQNMIDSGYERAISDWLIGMNLTMAFTNTSGSLVTVGRVMTPTLAMVVNRQKEIDEFVPTDYYGVGAVTNSNTPIWKATKGSKYFESDKLYNDGGFIKKEDRDALIDDLKKDMHLTVEDVTVANKKEYAPLLYNLADIQSYGSKYLHLSPAQTLSIVQELYEAKLVTYPRTDARVISSAVASEIHSKTGKNVGKKWVNDAKITDHYAIIPTNYSNNRSHSLSGTKASIYEAICKRFDAIFMNPYTYDSVSVTYVHKNGERFYISGKNDIDLGWRSLYTDKVEGCTPPTKNSVVDVSEYIERNEATTAPSPYSTGTLILAMEKAGKLIEDEELREQIKTCGIGTSATRANIIEKLKDKEYITIDKNQKIAPTETGKAIIPIVAKFDAQLVSPEKTADMEKNLSDVAEGNMTRADYDNLIMRYIVDSCGHILAENHETVNTGNNSDGKSSNKGNLGNCLKCGKPVVNGKFGIYCTGKCGMSFKIYGKELTEKQVSSLLSHKSVMSKAKGKNGSTFTNTILPEIEECEWNGKTYYNFKILKK